MKRVNFYFLGFVAAFLAAVFVAATVQYSEADGTRRLGSSDPVFEAGGSDCEDLYISLSTSAPVLVALGNRRDTFVQSPFSNTALIGFGKVSTFTFTSEHIAEVLPMGSFSTKGDYNLYALAASTGQKVIGCREKQSGDN